MVKIRLWIGAGLLVGGVLAAASCLPPATEIPTETSTATATAPGTETTPAESETSNTSLYFIAGGFLLVLLAAVLEAYCAFGRLAREDVKPGVFKTPIKWVLEALWVIMLLAGGVMLLFVYWAFAAIAVIAFWLVLPFLITPIMRNRLLPAWDEVKGELEPKGYNEKTYWREDWWMVESKQKPKKKKA